MSASSLSSTPIAAVDLPGAGEPAPEPRRDAEVELTVGELAAVTGTVLVAAVGTWSLALAQLAHHDGWAAVGLGLVTTVVVALVAHRLGPRVRVRFDRVEAALLVVVAVAGAFFFLPGFHYAWNDKDPGVYVLHGFAIAEGGDVYVDDEVVQAGIDPPFDNAGRFSGMWTDIDHPGQVTSQFFHFYSSLLATAHDLGGARALFNTNPLLGLGSVCLVVLAARRVAGTLVAGLVGALLVTSMIQVWQAKYPSSEIPAQFLLAGTMLAAVLAIQRRWAGGALVAGLLTGVGFLARPDGFLYILLGAGVAALAIAAGRVDRRVVAFLAGLAVTIPYGVWNAVVARPEYSASTDVPGGAELVGGTVAVVAGGFAVRASLQAARRRWPDAGWTDVGAVVQRWHRPLGAVVAVGFGVALLLFFFSPDIWGEQYHYNILSRREQRSFNELNMQWLTWFTTVRGMAVLWLGFCVVMLRRWRASLWLLAVPGAGLLLLYLYDARVSMRLMWWVRRFVPAVLPTMVVLIAIGLAFLLTRRWWAVRAVGAVLAVSLVVEYAQTSLPLRHHDEMGGSWDMAAGIADAAGDRQGVFLFPPYGRSTYSVSRNAPGAVWWLFDQAAARLPVGYGMPSIEQYRRAFPRRPVFLVIEGEALPDDLPAGRFRRARVVTGELHVWEELLDARPSREVVMPMGVTVWELVG